MNFYMQFVVSFLMVTGTWTAPVRESHDIEGILDYYQRGEDGGDGTETATGNNNVDDEEATKILRALDSLWQSWLSSNGKGAAPQPQEVISSPELRQHWSHGFMPGGRRSDPSLAPSTGADQLDASAIASIIRYFLENQSESYVDQLQDGKGMMVSTRQHWSNSWQPGGKRSADPATQEKRQHWSYGFGPGGKRSVDMIVNNKDKPVNKPAL